MPKAPKSSGSSKAAAPKPRPKQPAKKPVKAKEAPKASSKPTKAPEKKMPEKKVLEKKAPDKKPAAPSKPAPKKPEPPAAAKPVAAKPEPAKVAPAAAPAPAGAAVDPKKVPPKGITVVQNRPMKKPKPKKLEMPPTEPLFKPGGKWKPLIPSGPKAPPTGMAGQPTFEPAQISAKVKLSKKELDRYKEILLAKRAELVGDISNMEDEALRGNSGSLSSLPQHMAEQGSDTFDQSLSLDLAQVDRNLIKEIDEALTRIDDGTYGVCLRTGQRISPERLGELPWAKFSIEAQREMERQPYLHE